MQDELFLNIEQIIPTKDVEQFMVTIADKALDEAGNAVDEKNRHKVRREFWIQVIKAMAAKSPLFQNISPGVQSWIGAGSGVRGVGFNFVAGRSYARAEVYIDRGERDENKSIFDALLAQREKIEAAFGGELVWERLDGKRACRIKAETPGNIFDRDAWPAMIDYMIDAMLRLEKAVRELLPEIGKSLKKGGGA